MNMADEDVERESKNPSRSIAASPRDQIGQLAVSAAY